MREELFEARKKVIMDIINDDNYVPMKIKEIAILLQVPKSERSDLEEVLTALTNEGKISLTKKGKYCKGDMNLLTGVFQATQRGFGFVAIEGEEDIFISEDEINGAFNSDIVNVRILEGKTGKRREGTIVGIVERGVKEIVGIYQKNKNFGFVIPDNQKFNKDIFIPAEKSMGAVTGHKVVVKITDYGKKGKKPEGKVTEIIGHVNDPGTDIMSIIKSYGLPLEFPDNVMHQLKDIPDEVDTKEMAGRVDIRSWQTVTIDGEDAKDLDDAITITKKDGKYTLGVHIADVTHYVTEGSPLDKEALKRGTSVYLVDRVIPMLPHKLSSGICSLNQGVDRLALSCIMNIDEKGNVYGHKICETVINVDRRMSYTNVKHILEKTDENVINEYKELVPMFELMKELAEILRKKRFGRGSIDFDFPESKIILDDKGRPIDIKPYERNVATRIIEDFMLIANETVAEDHFWQELPFVYRTHDNPDPEKIQRLGMFINNFGYSIRMTQDDIHPKELQKLLEKIEGSDEEALISRLTLRSLKRAQYTTHCTGHFGLAAKYYCHFTSPIRRYPDLQIHRIIKENLHGKLNDRRITHYNKILDEVAKQSSTTERRADDAERDTDKLKKVEYMSHRIGEIFEGVISGVTSWGFYVELPNTVEGMVHVNTLKDDYYYFSEEEYALKAEMLNKEYKLGQKVKVVLVNTDKMTRTIDFELYDERDIDMWGDN